MAKYRKKPVTIEAIQWTGKNEREMFDFLTENAKKNERPTLEEDTFRIDLVNGGCQVGNLMIKTKEGDMKADIGDYVIKEPYPTNDRKFYPCKLDIFKKAYEKVNIQSDNSTVNKKELAYRFLELPYVIKEQLMSKYGLVKEEYICKEYTDVVDKIIEDVQEKNCIDEFAKEVLESR